jgi:hypothetical protein
MFRFTTRDLLWLTVVAALCVGWFVHQRNLSVLTEKLRYSALSAGYRVFDDGQRAVYIGPE